MKIVRETTPEVSFASIHVGIVFEWGHGVYMKAEPAADENALNLETGKWVPFTDDQKVVARPDAELRL